MKGSNSTNSIGSNTIASPFKTRFLHGLLWFITGFFLSCGLSHMQSQNVSKFILSIGGQQHGSRTSFFMYETEIQQQDNPNNFQYQMQSPQMQYQEQQNLKSGGIPFFEQSPLQKSENRQIQQRVLSGPEMEVLAGLDFELKHGLEDIGQEIIDEEMLIEKVSKESAYPRYTTPWDTMERQPCFIFIAVLTLPQHQQEREALREAWVSEGNKKEGVVVRFVMLENERTLSIEKEVSNFSDFLFLPKPSRKHKFQLHKVYKVFEYVAEHYQASFVLKTDDVAFVNVPVLMHYLKQHCQNEDCLHERLYIGYENTDSPVMRDSSQSGFKEWINQKYYEVVKKDKYIPYMMGGGYILSGDLVEILVSMHRNVGLFWSPIEDGTVGMWLAGLNVRRVSNQHSFLTQDFDCCFYEFPDMPWHPWIGHHRLVVDVCKTDIPRLILHSIKNQTYMKTLGWRVRKCDFSNLLNS